MNGTKLVGILLGEDDMPIGNYANVTEIRRRAHRQRALDAMRKRRDPDGIEESDDWNTVMDVYRKLGYPEQQVLRREAGRRLVERGAEEVGSSDANHEIYVMIKSGEYQDVLNNFFKE